MDGLIIAAPLSESAELIQLLDRRKLPFVRMSPSNVRHRSPYVEMDDEGAAREMTEHLIAGGHRRIAFIVGHPAHYASGLRLKGYKEALRKHGIPFQQSYVKQGYFVYESGFEAARELLRLRKPPTAIFASNDDMAAGVLMAAHEMNIPVPEQLSVVGFDDTYVARIVWPRLTTVHQPSYDMAYAATDLLLQTLKGGTAPGSVRLPYELVFRESTATLSGGTDRSRTAGASST